MVGSKRDSPRYELHVGNTKIKMAQKINYKGSVLIDNRKYDAEIWKCIEIAKGVYQKLRKVLRVENIVGGEKKRYWNAM